MLVLFALIVYVVRVFCLLVCLLVDLLVCIDCFVSVDWFAYLFGCLLEYMHAIVPNISLFVS